MIWGFGGCRSPIRVQGGSPDGDQGVKPPENYEVLAISEPISY